MTRMRIIIAPDSFKDSLGSKQLIGIIGAQAKRVFPSCELTGIPMADGGEGTLEALMDAVGERYIDVPAADPLFRPIRARLGILRDGAAVIEMSAASGLMLLPRNERNPLLTSSFGTGRMIAAALDAGCQDIVIGIGGSATNDGGIGAMAALGARFTDADGNGISPVGGNLGRIAAIDAAHMHAGISRARFRAMCDVDNPLLGPRGATAVFGPQKGADEDGLRLLESGMENYAKLLGRAFGFDPAAPGSGAAGGLGAALTAFLKARMQPGIEMVMELSGFGRAVKNADLVVTGEGRADGQSAHGKVLSGIGRMCRAHGVPAVAIVGGMGDGAEEIYACGIESLVPAVSGIMTLGEALSRSEPLLADAAYRLFSLIKVGMGIERNESR